jgi:hypothetical protein
MTKVLMSLALVVTIATGCAMAETDERVLQGYLRGSEGPYRGRVIDAKTKKPIKDVIVVAVWYYDSWTPVHTVSTYYDALEVVTDDQGYFIVDAPQIERRAPSRTEFPVFSVFKPGYDSYRGWFASENEMAQRKQMPLLGTIELEMISHLSKQDQLRKLPFNPTNRGVPDNKIPRFLKALVEHREALLR